MAECPLRHQLRCWVHRQWGVYLVVAADVGLTRVDHCHASAVTVCKAVLVDVQVLVDRCVDLVVRVDVQVKAVRADQWDRDLTPYSRRLVGRCADP